MPLDKGSNLEGNLSPAGCVRGNIQFRKRGGMLMLADAYDSRVYPRHTAEAAAVASFRTWRSSRRAVARGPAIISACKPSASPKAHLLRYARTSSLRRTRMVRLIPQISQALHMGFLLCCKSKKNGGERGIRTLGTLLTYTRFPGVLLQPLGHLSVQANAEYSI